jgi:uncharacterized protein YecE (DUF72 family)
MAGSGARSSEPPSGGDGQGDLFGGVPSLPASAPRRRVADATVGAAPADPSLAPLAATLPASLRLGTSSWGFSGWAGMVYDRSHPESQLSRQGLAAYARHPLLRAVGVDRGFYAPVPEADLERYAAAVPADFRFLLKAHAALTTVPGPSPPPYLAGVPAAFLDVAHAQRAVVDPAARALGGRLGALLFQFSPLGARVLRHRLRLLDRLHGFLRALPRGLPYAVEFRDPEMLGPDYDALLADVGAVHGACAHPRMPSVATQFGAGARSIRGPLVVRWLLHPGATYEAARRRYAPFDRLVDPDPLVRGEIATVVFDALESGREALIIVNNKAEGSAPLGIVALARHMASLRGAS